MSSVDGISLLENLILSSPALKAEDQAVIKHVCLNLRIEQEHGFINDYFRRQVEIEATAVYLTGKYNALLERWRRIIGQHKADKFMELGSKNDDGYKWTKEAKEQWLLSTDARYTVLSEQAQEAERLLYILRDLSNVVFTRDKKLEQLSINYRRESEADKRAS